MQQQQLEHQRSQLLSETRGLFFALAVSVAVIIAGVAPLVEASSEDRRLILIVDGGRVRDRRCSATRRSAPFSRAPTDSARHWVRAHGCAGSIGRTHRLFTKRAFGL